MPERPCTEGRSSYAAARPAAMIVVNFKDQVPAELVAEMLSTGFGGLCKATQAGSGPRSVVLRPTQQEYAAVKAQLDEFAKEGALAFTEQAG